MPQLGESSRQRSRKEPRLVSAAKLFEKACDDGLLPSCVQLGHLHQTGKGVAKDDEQAKKLFDKACKGGEQTGCKSLEPPKDAGKKK